MAAVIDGRSWIEQLPAELQPQKDLLSGMLALCRSDPEIAWLLIGCSLGRGVADWMSDLDVAMGVRDESFDSSVVRILSAVPGLGELVDCFDHRMAGVAIRHRRIFAQFKDRSQIDLMLIPTSVGHAGVPNSILLYGPEEEPEDPALAAPVPSGTVREWAFLAWAALADLGKYLRRRSPWEARMRLEEARVQLWRLLALADHVPDPQYGLTSILDFAPQGSSDGVEDTLADLDSLRLLRAGRNLAQRLNRVADRLSPEQGSQLPGAMARYVTQDLADLDLD